MGSHCTPAGRHIIADKIGAHAPIGSVFVARAPTGEIYSEALALAYPDRGPDFDADFALGRYRRWL